MSIKMESRKNIAHLVNKSNFAEVSSLILKVLSGADIDVPFGCGFLT